jgi:hypothetical protein
MKRLEHSILLSHSTVSTEKARKQESKKAIGEEKVGEEKESGTVDMSVGVGLPQLLPWTAPRTHRRLQIEHARAMCSVQPSSPKGTPASDAPLQPLLLSIAESRCHLARPIRVTTHQPRR